MTLAAALSLLLTLGSLSAEPPTPTGTILVANMNDDSVWLLDAESGEMMARIPTHIAPHEIAVTSDGGRAAVTNYGDQRGPGNLIQFLDVSAGELLHEITIEGYERLHGAAFLPGDSLLALTSERTGEVLIVDPTDGTIRRSLSTSGRASHMLALGGSWIWAANIVDGTVSRMDASGRMDTETWPAGTRTEGLATTPDGREGWTGSMEGGDVVGIDAETGEEVARVTGLAVPYRLAITPDGRTVLVSDPQTHVLGMIERATGTLTRVDVGAAAQAAGLGSTPSPQGFVLSRDGVWAFVSLKAVSRVAVIDLASGEVVAFHQTGAGPDGISYSPVRVAR